jgi:acyl-CoA dehydrogenase
MISTRMGDILSEMYIISAALKRWQDEGRHEADLPVLNYAAEAGFQRIQTALDDVIVNLPARWAAWVLRGITWPGRRETGPSDRLVETCSDLIYAPSPTRDRITGGIGGGCLHPGITLLNECYAQVNAMAPVMKRLRDARKTPNEGVEAGILSNAELQQITAMQDLVARVIAVDDFTPYELPRYFNSYSQNAQNRYAGARDEINSKEAAQ